MLESVVSLSSIKELYPLLISTVQRPRMAVKPIDNAQRISGGS